MKPTPSTSSSQAFYTVAANYRAAGRTKDRPAPADENAALERGNTHAVNASSAIGGGAGAEACPARPAAGSSYLEQDRNPVTIHQCEPRYELKPHGCGSWFCPHCCKSKGIKLKHKLIPVLMKFRRVMMLTLTIDPEHFASPQDAIEHVKANRCIGVTMQQLRRAGVLLSERWFSVIEWQQNGWPHWHVLVEAERIPFNVLTDAWNRNLHKLGKIASETRTGFGSVRFTISCFDGAKHAAGYACAYLTKHPEHGYPDWVQASEIGKLHRYSTSRGFWKDHGTPADEPADESETSDASDEGLDRSDESEAPERKRLTIAEQVKACGTESTDLFLVIEQYDAATGERLKPIYRFLERIEQALPVLLAKHPDLRPGSDGRTASVPGSWQRSELNLESSKQSVDRGFVNDTLTGA